MASILFLDGFSANFEYKISLTSPSVETGDRKMFSDVLTWCFFRRKKCCKMIKINRSVKTPLHKPSIEIARFRLWSPAWAEFPLPNARDPGSHKKKFLGFRTPQAWLAKLFPDSRIQSYLTCTAGGDKVKRSNYYLPTRYSTVRATQHKILKSMSQWNKFLGISFCHNHNQLLSSPEVFLKWIGIFKPFFFLFRWLCGIRH